MMQNLTYLQKNYLLIISFIVFLIIGYLLAFGKTIKIIGENTQLKKEIETARSAPQRIAELEKDLTRFETQLGSVSVGITYREALLDFSSQFCKDKHLKISEYKEGEFNKQSSYSIETNTIVFDGPFIETVELIFEIENEKRLSKVVNAHYEKVEDRQTDKVKLLTTLNLQNIHTNDD